ncbi:MAG TPA: hypothetical protein VJT15_25630 [Pyrinomonadaceae bacterium]|nr:hypothetical protein [Pyrinomonadaceae bacterium]
MSAQTAAMKKRKKEDWDPVTPVIIKSGSGNDTYNLPINPSLVSIDSPMLTFTESAPGLTWESSRSNETGRITNVTIKDGAELVGMSIKPTAELVTVEIAYAVDTLTVSEAESGVLVINSPEAPFTVQPGTVLPAGEWDDSTATFPNAISSVTVMVGSQEALKHVCQQSKKVTVTLAFDLGG